MGKTFKYYNLTGGLNTRDGVGTINATGKYTESPDMLNIEFYNNGGLKSMAGNKQFSDTQFKSAGKLENLRITLGYEYILKNKKILIVTTSDGSVWKYSSPDNKFRLIYKFPTETDRHSIAGFNFGIIISNGIDDLVYYRDDQLQTIDNEVKIVANSNIATATTAFNGEILPGDYVLLDGEEQVFPLEDSETRETDLFLGHKVTAVSSDNKQITLDKPISTAYTGKLTLSRSAECLANYSNYDDTGATLPVRGLALQVYQGRIWVGGTDGTLYYSEIGLIHGWSNKYGAGAIPSFYNDNSDFTALAPWDKYLVLFKRERSYLLNGTDSDDTNWSIEPYSNYTCDSQQSFIDINNGLYIYSRVAGGIYPMLQRTIYSANYQGIEASQKIREEFNLINTEAYDSIFPVYQPKKKFLCFYTPLSTGLGSNNVFILDLNVKTWLHRRVPQDVTIAFRFNDKVYIGTSDGLILEEFVETNFNGEPIEFYWKSPWFTFGDGSDYLSTRECRVNMAEGDNNKYQVRVHRDGRDEFKKRKVTNNQNNKEALIWDIGFNRDELNTSYTDKLTCYEIQDIFENKFYTKYPHLATDPPEDIGQVGVVVPEYMGIYTASTLTKNDFIGYASEYIKLIDTTEDDPDGFSNIVATQGYKYTYTHKQYVRYTNGTDYVWIPWIDKTPKVGQNCLISMSESSKELRAKGFTINLFQSWKYGYKTVYAFTDGSFKGIAQNADGTEIKQQNLEGTGRLYTVLLMERLGKKTTDVNKINSYMWTTTWQELGSGKPGKGESIDLYKTVGISTGSDITKASEAIMESVNETSDGVYTLVLNGNTFKNMKLEDVLEGDDITEELYTKEELKKDVDTYGESEFLVDLGDGVTATTVKLNSNGETVTVTSEGNFFYEVPKYQKYVTVFYEYTGNNTQLKDPQKLTLYQPTEEEYNQSITDTTWDNNTWVANKQIIKRFPLADQYFNTLQIEFYGNGLEDALALNGFELHGVELEETPWR